MAKILRMVWPDSVTLLTKRSLTSINCGSPIVDLPPFWASKKSRMAIASRAVQKGKHYDRHVPAIPFVLPNGHWD